MYMLIAVLRWLPACVLMTVIFMLSSLPSSEVPDFGALDFLVLHAGHFLGYALLCLAFQFALPRRLSPGIRSIAAIMLALLYAVSDEWHQSFVPGRSQSLFDIIVDGLGASTAMFLLARYSPNSSSNSISSSES